MGRMSFVITEFGHREDTLRAIASITRHFSPASFNILVGNDAYPDPLPDIAEVTVINWPENVGYARNSNRSVAEMRCSADDILFLLNNDIAFFPGAIHFLASYAKDHHAIVGPSIIVPDHMALINRQVQHKDTFETRSIELFHPTMLSGCCMVMQYPIWTEIGGFDEDFILQYSDDDLCVRAAALGIEITCQPQALITHEWGKTMNPTHNYYRDDVVKKDQETFARKHPSKRWDSSGEY